MLRQAGFLVLVAVAAAGGFLAMTKMADKQGYAADEPTAPEIDWVAAAPGRIEPRSGELRMGTTYLGRVEEVLVEVEDKVEESELLIRLDDAEARAKLTSAETQAEALREEREKQFASGREDIRRAEDAIYAAERAVTGARIELDGALGARRKNNSSEQNLADARKRHRDAKDRLERERQAFAKAQSKSNLPAPSSAESAVSAARTEVRMAEALLEKTRIRAPANGTVLQVNAKEGEIVAPSMEVPLVVTGDMTAIRVKAEIDEGDVSKVRVGQKAYVTSVSQPGKRYEGRVSALAPSLGAAKIGPRGPRRTNDVDVLEVTIDLDQTSDLLPGMRVDTFFKKT